MVWFRSHIASASCRLQRSDFLLEIKMPKERGHVRVLNKKGVGFQVQCNY